MCYVDLANLWWGGLPSALNIFSIPVIVVARVGPRFDDDLGGVFLGSCPQCNRLLDKVDQSVLKVPQLRLSRQWLENLKDSVYRGLDLARYRPRTSESINSTQGQDSPCAFTLPARDGEGLGDGFQELAHWGSLLGKERVPYEVAQASGNNVLDSP